MAARILFSFLIVIFFHTIALGQVHPGKDRQSVLRHNKVGKEYVFDRSKAKDYNRTEITYLGQVKTSDGRIFKILISRWYWGLVPRVTSRIVVYNNRNQYLGNYYVDMTNDLPDRLKNNVLIFTNKDNEDCDQKLIPRVSFKSGLPKQFFLKCIRNYGSLYSFGDE